MVVSIHAHGMCTLVKNNIADKTCIIADMCSVSTLWLKVSKAAFGHEFIIGNVYLPHEGSS